jgi:hypothetical protein
MEAFIDFLPSDLDRLKWYYQGYRVLCNSCWWVGLDEDYDQCPDCNSDRLEWIIEKEDDHNFIEAMLQSIKPIVSN